MALPYYMKNPTIRQYQGPIRSAVNRGLTNIEIHSMLRRRAGQSVANQTLGHFVKDIKAQEVSHGNLRFMRKGFSPDPTRLPQAYTNIRREYSFTVKVTGTFKGKREEGYVTVSTNENMPREEIERQAKIAINNSVDRSGGWRDDKDYEVQLWEGVKRGEQ